MRREIQYNSSMLLRNVFFTLVAIAIGFSAIACNAGSWLAPAATDQPEYSDLEARYYVALPGLTVESALDKSFQSTFDQYLSDHIPQRDRAVFFNAGLQRASIALSAASCGFDVYPTFFDSRYYVVPRDGLIVDRAEEAPAENGGSSLDAWIGTLNKAARDHPDIRFVYDCVARHDQTEANPTYRYYQNRLNPQWARENILDRLDKRIAAFVDAVESYEEIVNEWIATEEHWKLKRALKSYNKIAEVLSLKKYAYENPVTVVDSWYGDYSRNGLDLDISVDLEDIPLDFSQLAFYELGDADGTPFAMGLRDDVLAGKTAIAPGGVTKYYEYFGGGNAEVLNDGENNGKTALVVCDSLSYCLERFIASNYRHTVFLLPGNTRKDGSLEDFIATYDPDDVIILMHVTKYEMVASYSPTFIGLE